MLAYRDNCPGLWSVLLMVLILISVLLGFWFGELSPEPLTCRVPAETLSYTSFVCSSWEETHCRDSLATPSFHLAM